jgi:hypothetical protein
MLTAYTILAQIQKASAHIAVGQTYVHTFAGRYLAATWTGTHSHMISPVLRDTVAEAIADGRAYDQAVNGMWFDFLTHASVDAVSTGIGH